MLYHSWVSYHFICKLALGIQIYKDKWIYWFPLGKPHILIYLLVFPCTVTHILAGKERGWLGSYKSKPVLLDHLVEIHNSERHWSRKSLKMFYSNVTICGWAYKWLIFLVFVYMSPFLATILPCFYN